MRALPSLYMCHKKSRYQFEFLEPRILFIGPSIGFAGVAFTSAERGIFRILVSLTGQLPTGQQARVTAQTLNGSAVAGEDFTSTQTTITFSEFQTSKTF